MAIHTTVAELIGNTPLVELHNVTDGVRAKIAVKVEYFNPGGSSKDRIAERIIGAAEREGKLRPGGVIVEPTSGNTGVGLALVAQQRGYRTVFVLPDKVSETKRAVLRAYGAEVVVTPTDVEPDDPRSYYSVSDRLAREIPGAFKPNQYSNLNGSRSHYETTGHRDLGGKRGRCHPLRGRHWHGRHHLGNRPLSQGSLEWRGHGDRRRSRGLHLLEPSQCAWVRHRGRGRGLLPKRL